MTNKIRAHNYFTDDVTTKSADYVIVYDNSITIPINKSHEQSFSLIKIKENGDLASIKTISTSISYIAI